MASVPADIVAHIVYQNEGSATDERDSAQITMNEGIVWIYIQGYRLGYSQHDAVLYGVEKTNLRGKPNETVWRKVPAA